MGGGRLVEGLTQLLGLLGQRHAGGVVSSGLGRLAQAVVQAEGAEHHAARRAQAAPTVGAQLEAQAPQAASVVVSLVQQVAHLQPSLVVGAVQLGAQLVWRVARIIARSDSDSFTCCRSSLNLSNALCMLALLSCNLSTGALSELILLGGRQP